MASILKFLPAALLGSFLFVTGIHAAPRIETDATFDPAAAAPIRVVDAQPGEKLTVVAIRSLPVWRPDASGNWAPQPTRFTAWADVQADTKGRVDLASATPIAGSYKMADPLALLWSGYPDGRDEIPGYLRGVAADMKQNVRILLMKDGKQIASAALPLAEDVEDLRISTVQQPGLVGVFAAPKNGRKLPTLIVLHGSEGNNIEKARSNALTYAQQGFATLAIAWYTLPYEPAEHVPTSGHLIDVNQLERARDWLMQQPEADTRRLGLWGQSKGGEFAMLAASRFSWVKAAVGCVPSDIVWQGFGEGENTPPPRSTWVFDGKPLPFVPLYPVVEGRYRDNTDRYERSRRFNADAAQAARIPIEKTNARLLLIAGDRDEVWASGTMARNLADRMSMAGKGKQVQSLLFAKAGHGVCGDGSFPVRAYGKDDPDPDRKNLNAEGHANVNSFRATVSFLKEAL
ncbi:MAG: acyl-CoA thioester hydrolase/BAAT C-terminal domain-containing protein [Sphingorhabdus sp.]